MKKWKDGRKRRGHAPRKVLVSTYVLPAVKLILERRAERMGWSVTRTASYYLEKGLSSFSLEKTYKEADK